MMQDTLNSFFSQLEPAPWLCYVFPVLALGILVRCAVSLLTFRQEPEVWAWLTTPDGTHIPVTHWESLVGRGAGCDVQLGYPTISRTHAVLTRYDDGSWTISDAQSKSGVFVNGRQTALAALRFGDVITMGGVNFTLVPITKEQERIQAGTRTRAGRAAGADAAAFDAVSAAGGAAADPQRVRRGAGADGIRRADRAGMGAVSRAADLPQDGI